MMFRVWYSESGNNATSFRKHKGPQPLVELSSVNLGIHSRDLPAARSIATMPLDANTGDSIVMSNVFARSASSVLLVALFYCRSAHDAFQGLHGAIKGQQGFNSRWNRSASSWAWAAAARLNTNMLPQPLHSTILAAFALETSKLRCSA